MMGAGVHRHETIWLRIAVAAAAIVPFAAVFGELLWREPGKTHPLRFTRPMIQPTLTTESRPKTPQVTADIPPVRKETPEEPALQKPEGARTEKSPEDERRDLHAVTALIEFEHAWAKSGDNEPARIRAVLKLSSYTSAKILTSLTEKFDREKSSAVSA